MNDPLAMYREQIEQVELCTEKWFSIALTEAQSGDDRARRRIVGGCLRVALRVVERTAPDLPPDDCLALVESANHGLWCSVDTFVGGSAADFVRHAEREVETHLGRQGI